MPEMADNLVIILPSILQNVKNFLGMCWIKNWLKICMDKQGEMVKKIVGTGSNRAHTDPSDWHKW